MLELHPPVDHSVYSEIRPVCVFENPQCSSGGLFDVQGDEHDYYVIRGRPIARKGIAFLKNGGHGNPSSHDSHRGGGSGGSHQIEKSHYDSVERKV